MKLLVTAMLIACTLVTSGCAPLALAGGAVVVSMISQDLQKREAARNIERQRQASLRQQAEQTRLRQEEQERARLAAIEQQRAEESRRRQLAIAEREREQAREQDRQREMAQRERAATARAQRFLSELEAALVEGRWSRSDLPALRGEIDAISKSPAQSTIVARAQLGTGLYAFLLDDRSAARAYWTTARRSGATNPRVVAPAVWTPGAVEAFEATK